jgi:hypothetical protein
MEIKVINIAPENPGTHLFLIQFRAYSALYKTHSVEYNINQAISVYV